MQSAVQLNQREIKQLLGLADRLAVFAQRLQNGNGGEAPTAKPKRKKKRAIAVEAATLTP